MAMTNTESQVLCNSQWFRDKIKSAIAKYATYLQNTPENDPNYANKVGAGRYIANQADMVVVTAAFLLSGSPDMANFGPGITDDQLQSLIEGIMLRNYPIAPAPVTP